MLYLSTKVEMEVIHASVHKEALYKRIKSVMQRWLMTSARGMLILGFKAFITNDMRERHNAVIRSHLLDRVKRVIQERYMAILGNQKSWAFQQWKFFISKIGMKSMRSLIDREKRNRVKTILWRHVYFHSVKHKVLHAFFTWKHVNTIHSKDETAQALLHSMHLKENEHKIQVAIIKKEHIKAVLRRQITSSSMKQKVQAFSKWKAIATDIAVPAKLQDHVLGTLRLKI